MSTDEPATVQENLMGTRDAAFLDLKDKLFYHLERRKPHAIEVAVPALTASPHDPEILLMTVVAALLDDKPQVALRYLHRFTKRFVPYGREDQLLKAVALAQQGIWRLAWNIVDQHGRFSLRSAAACLPIGPGLHSWFGDWLERIEDEERRRRLDEKRAEKADARRRTAAADAAKALAPDRRASVAAQDTETPAMAEGVPALPRHNIAIPLSIELPASLETDLASAAGGNATGADDVEMFRLRYELAELGLLQGFDELLCLPALRGVEIYWYQVEAARRALKQFRGRVLLADEVGLGKTIEAGMILKEYILRGMAEHVLILTPATLVRQWHDELASKFDVDFVASYDAQIKTDPAAFWSQPRVIASIATARRAEHREILARRHYDLVIVDEAHHLKNRGTSNWELLNALQKRFLLLLSATPVQNSLLELYNLLTLLKPGIFKTEREFRASYMTNGKPRVPANRDQLRDLMREVMIRNTRSLVDVHLPPRHALTIRLDAEREEALGYETLSRLVAQAAVSATSQERFALRRLMSAAGSTPAAAAAAIERYLGARDAGEEWRELMVLYSAIGIGVKEKALVELLRRNEAEKKIVFVHHRETLAQLSELFDREELRHEIFEGGMSAAAKDAAIARFRDDVPLLLSTESGGEGRNLQFSNTLINFDLPWNPMAIEQRIGRLHRIGQTRDVFIFNLVARGTLEERMLQVLDEKINMFELVVGEIDAILGEMDESNDFAELAFSAWVATTDAARAVAFDALGERLLDARRQYERVKVLDEELFGEDFVAG